MVSVIVLKVIFIFLMLITAGAAGFLPLFFPSFHSNKKILSLGNCFAAGIFIIVGMAGLLPDAQKSFEEDFSSEMPLAYLIAVAGYLIIFFVENVLFHHSHSDETDSIENSGLLNIEIADEPHSNKDLNRGKTVSAIILTAALIVHSIFEGIALGLLKSESQTITLSCAVLIHNIPAAIALGIKMETITKPMYLTLMTLFVLSSPISVIIGIFISNLGFPAIEGIFLSFSAGTFLYIACTEILPEEMEKHENKGLKFLAFFLGCMPLGIDLKKRLDALHYCHPLTPHSAVLVEALLTDLLKVTSANSSLKSENSVLISQQKDLSDKLLAYQREISRLGTENNNLHFELMNTKETSASSLEKWRVSLKRLENECEDLKALSAIQQTKYKEIESERDDLKNKLQQIFNKIYNPVTEKGLKDSALSKKEKNRVRKMEFKVSEYLEESEECKGFSRSQQEWAQELQDSDERIKKYQEQVEELVKNKEDLVEDLKRAQEKIRNRDLEIERLVDILNAGEFAVKTPNRIEKIEKDEKITVLNERLDFLNSEHMALQQEYQKAREKLAQIGIVDYEFK